MKLTLVTLALTLLSFNLFAQKLNGVVIDNSSYLPVANAAVIAPSSRAMSSAMGKFTLANVHPGDTIRISSLGYKPYFYVMGFVKLDTSHFYIKQNLNMLSEVKIRGKRDAKADSLRRRKEFASVFNHKATSVKDIFITPPATKYVPDDYINAHNNTTEILSVNLLQVAALFNKNKAPVSKVQKLLIKDEEDEYVDRFFSQDKVEAITNLKGDSLQNFMDRYHPSIKTVKKMTDYDMVVYIKKSYANFLKTYKSDTPTPFVK